MTAQKKLTLAQFDAIPRREIFATGIVPNSRNIIDRSMISLPPVNGMHMVFYSNFQQFSLDPDKIRWVAKKGSGHDWAIYFQLEIDMPSEPAKFTYLTPKSEEEIIKSKIQMVAQYGAKLFGESRIQLCVPCTKQVLKLYRR